jgi:hypothetical protein
MFSNLFSRRRRPTTITVKPKPMPRMRWYS